MIAQSVLAALIIFECLLLGGAKVLRFQPMRERAAHVGFTMDDTAGSARSNCWPRPGSASALSSR